MSERLAGPLTTIRFRLGAGLALALAPVLVLGLAQAVLDFRKDAEAERVGLALAAERSAATARAEMTSAGVLLETLAPAAVGLDCAQRLSEITHRLPGYQNLIRFSPSGRVICAAGDVPSDPNRAAAPWFQRLASGEDQVVMRAPSDLVAGAPALFAAQRVQTSTGQFDGAQVAVIALDSLRPSLSDRSLPSGTEVEIIDGQGGVLTRTRADAFTPVPAGFAEQARGGSMIYRGFDAHQQMRVNSVAPLAGDVYVVLSAPAPGLFSWARLNPLSALFLPLLAFTLALLSVWIVAERVVIRWLNYLQRIAQLYGKGRMSVRPLQAEHAPAEIHELALALEEMADSITARDGSLRSSLDEKDALMREIHHRVKNNLQVISSLLSMQERALVDITARGAMSDTRRRIGALALIYRALYQGVDLKKVNVRLFLGDLVGQQVLEHQAAGHVVRTELSADELIIDPDKLAPFALFAVEAISNAQKHAFAGRGGTLRVSFKVVGEEAQLQIADDGPGPETPRPATGVGRTLMTAFARQLHGRAETTPNEWGGTTARLDFPIPDSLTAPFVGDTARGKRNRAAA